MATKLYTKTIELDERNAQAFFNLGNSLYLQNKFQESIKAYLHALTLDKVPECHFNLAQAYNDLCDYESASKHYMKAIELDEGNTKAYLQLGSIYEQKAKW